MTRRAHSTVKAAGMVTALHQMLSSTKDWNSLPREGVLRCLADLKSVIDGDGAVPDVPATLLLAQESR